MNIQFRQAMSLVLLFGGFTWAVAAHAGPQPSQLTPAGSGSGLGSGPSSGIGGVSGVGSIGATAAISVPCIGSNGKVMNADPASVCQAILPKCTDLRKDIEDKVKNLLSMKIYGFYSGYNLDLNNSSPDKPVGPKMQYAMCSLVGQKMQNNGSDDDFEITSESVSKTPRSCGNPPVIDTGTKGKVTIKYEGDQDGSLWISYLQGAYPWLIRKKAYDVFHKLDANLTNLNEVISDLGMTNDVKKLANDMAQLNQSLSESEKTVCQQTKDDESLIDKCKKGNLSISDPVARICKLVVAQLATNGMTIPNMLISEIMDGDHGVFDQYDDIFGQMLDFQNNGGTRNAKKHATASDPTMKNLAKSCADTGGFLSFRSRKKKTAQTAACLMGKTMSSHGKSATVYSCVNIANGTIEHNGGNTVKHIVCPGRPNYTYAFGVPAVIEKLIRHNVCGQNRTSDSSVCDQIDIPSKPDGVKW